MLGCTGNVVSVGVFGLGPDTVLEVQFELPDGGVSDWQKVALEVSPRTLEDFNGPGCPCTYFEAVAPPVLVPVALQ